MALGKKQRIGIDRPSLEYLAHPGPHRVAAGNLADGGLPGLVFAPVAGRALPLVAISHGWLQPAHRYADTMRYLASWGLVVVAPDTQKGPVPSHGDMALDLAAALHLVAQSSLAGGRVRVDSERLGLIGHSIGGGAAVLAAAAESDIGAVVTVTAADDPPVGAGGGHPGPRRRDCTWWARTTRWPTVTAPRSPAAWAGPVSAAHGQGTPATSAWPRAVPLDHHPQPAPGNEKRIQHVVRMLATAFLLRSPDRSADQLADELESKISGTTVEDLDAIRAE